MAVPSKQNLTMTRGDTESVVVTMTSDGTTPVDVTGRTYRAQIRITKDAALVAATFACAITNASGGEITCSMTAGDTAALTVGTHYWDFEENDGGVVSTILAGTVNVLADVTR
jgi:phage tail sheath gpL-like